MPDAANDSEIIELSFEDPERFAAIFERYYQPIRRYAQRRLGQEAGEDVAARVFEVAFSERRRFDRRYPDARPWLFGIASNLVGKHARSVGAHGRAISRMAYRREEAPDLDALISRLDAEALRGVLEEALDSLHPRDREPLLLVAWAELTYEEVSVALAIPVGTVRSRLNRARRLLRELLSGVEGMS